MLTKVEAFGILTKLSLRQSLRQEKLMNKKFKKLQKTVDNSERICYLNKVAADAERTASQMLPKKVLDKRNEVLYNSNVPPESGVYLVN